MFGPGDLTKKKIDGVQYVTFHPNTIVYAVPIEQAKDLLSARIGIVWHTTYMGDSFENMTASYGVNVAGLRKTRKVWSQDAMLRDVSVATMDQKETAAVDGYLSQAGKLFRKISSSTLRQLGANPELQKLIEQYNNTFVRKGELLPDSRAHVIRLQKWLQDRYKAEKAKRTSAAGKKAQQQKLNEIMAFFSKQNTMSLIAMFELQKNLVNAKLILLKKLNTLTGIDTFVKSSKGYHVTGAEGFVAIDKLGGDAVKLVDRMEFSYNNFSPDIIKGWDKPSRN